MENSSRATASVDQDATIPGGPLVIRRAALAG